VYFELEYAGDWSLTREGRLSPAQTIAKATCKLHSQYLWLISGGMKELISLYWCIQNSYSVGSRRQRVSGSRSLNVTADLSDGQN
jgi:hypothetical protein